MKHMLFNKILRNDKSSEAPSNWPDNIKRIEQEAVELKKISQDVAKRLLYCPVFSGCCNTTSIMGSNSNVWNPNWSKLPIDCDKISKKLPEQNLAQCLFVSSERLSILNQNLAKVMSALSETNNKLGMERLKWAASVENNTLEKLRTCYEDMVPSLIKSRRQLWKQNADLKAMQDRLKSLENNSNIVSPNSPILPHNSNQQESVTSPTISAANESCTSSGVLNSSLNCVSSSTNQNGLLYAHENTKLNQLKSARDDLEAQIDHLKDLSLKEHYRFESSVIDLSKGLVDLLRNEIFYHQQCMKIIGQVLPEMESSISNNPVPVFGRELSQHLLTSRRHIAYTLELCVRHLDNPEILSEEGLFRIAGGKNKVDTLSSAFNVFMAEKIIKQYDHYVIADCLKQYLRSLPEPLLSHQLFDDWMRAVNQECEESRLSAMKVCLSKLPVAYYNNLSYLLGFLYKLTTFSEKNRMTPASLGIIFGPNLLSSDSSSSGLYNKTVGSVNTFRKKLRSVSNASHMMKKHAINHHDNLTYQISSDYSGHMSLDETGKTDKHHQRSEDDSMTKSMITTNSHSLVIETLISNFSYFFPNQTINFTSNIPPKVFPNTYRTKRQSSLNGLSCNDMSHNAHKIHIQSTVKSISSKDPNLTLLLKTKDQPKSMSTQYSRRTSLDSTTPTDMDNLLAKSSATTPTGKKNPDFRNGTLFPSCLYRRRVSDGTLNNLKITDHSNFIGSVDISDLPDIDSSCIDDCQSSSAKSSNECDDLAESGSTFDDTSQIQTHSNLQSAKYAPKSFHADVYDTLFALQSLNSFNANSSGDYLTRVRSVYEGRTLSKIPGCSQTPVVRRQTLNIQNIEESMSKSVTNDQSLQFDDELNQSNSQPETSIIRRPKPPLNENLKAYRESSPATIQTLCDRCGHNNEAVEISNSESINFVRKQSNKFCLEVENTKTIVNSIMRYSMPILPAHGLDKPTNG